MTWISVDDKLPRSGSQAIVCITMFLELLRADIIRIPEYQQVGCGVYHQRNAVWEVNGEFTSRVTHWMHFPDAPPLDDKEGK